MILISICAVLLSLMFGVLGPIVLWFRLINIADILAHTLLFSLVINYFTGLDLTIASILLSIIFVIMIQTGDLNKNDYSQKMTILGCAAIAFTVIARDFSNSQINMQEFLFGDLYSTNIDDLILLCMNFVFVILIIGFLYKKIILISISKEIARSNGVRVKLVLFVLLAVLGITIAISLKIVGVLLVTSMITIPASLSRIISKSPSSMLIISMFFSLFVCLFSIIFSLMYDISYAPIFAASLCVLYYFVLSINCLKNYFK